MVGAVSHHDRDHIACELVQARPNRESESGRIVRAVVVDPLVGADELPDNLGGAIGARVVDDQELVVDAVGFERGGERQQGRADRFLLVVRGDDDRKLQTGTFQRSTFRAYISRRISSIP